MKFKSIVAAAAIALAASIGTASAAGQLTARASGAATDRTPASERFAMLSGIQAEQMDAFAMDRIRGQALFQLLLQTELGVGIDLDVTYADVADASGLGAPIVGGAIADGRVGSCWTFDGKNGQ